MLKLNNVVACIALAIGLVTTAHATVVYESGTDGAFVSGNNPFTYQIVTQKFSLTANSNIDSLTYNAFTTNSTVPVTNVLVNFYASNGTTPGALLFSGNFGVANSVVIGGNGSYDFTDYTVNLPGVSLLAGDYFLGLLVSPQQWDQHWSIINWNHSNYGSDGFDHYFRLESGSDVPEPVSIALLGAALIGMTYLRQRQVKG